MTDHFVFEKFFYLHSFSYFCSRKSISWKEITLFYLHFHVESYHIFPLQFFQYRLIRLVYHGFHRYAVRLQICLVLHHQVGVDFIQ